MAHQTNVVSAQVLGESGAPSLPENPGYTEEDRAWINTLPMTQYLDRWRRAADNKIILGTAGKETAEQDLSTLSYGNTEDTGLG